MSKPQLPEAALFRRLSFATSAAKLSQCPEDSVAEVAFAGRSNAGKSSALNRLAEQRKLAKTSGTPGRTQLINFFNLSEDRYLVDLPGYGYAKVSAAVKQQWQWHLSDYLRRRQPLIGLVLLMDIRHPCKPMDQALLDFAVQRALKIQLLLTKADKLSRHQSQSAVAKLKQDCAKSGWEANVDAFSVRSGEGVETLQLRLCQWLGVANDNSVRSE